MSVSVWEPSSHDGTFTSTVTLETEGIGGISENAPSPDLGIISGIPSLRTQSYTTIPGLPIRSW